MIIVAQMQTEDVPDYDRLFKVVSSIWLIKQFYRFAYFTLYVHIIMPL